jgi:hypothetical protein
VRGDGVNLSLRKYARPRARVCVCVCVCVWVQAKVLRQGHSGVGMGECSVHTCVRASVHACMRACACRSSLLLRIGFRISSQQSFVS